MKISLVIGVSDGREPEFFLVRKMFEFSYNFKISRLNPDSEHWMIPKPKKKHELSKNCLLALASHWIESNANLLTAGKRDQLLIIAERNRRIFGGEINSKYTKSWQIMLVQSLFSPFFYEF